MTGATSRVTATTGQGPVGVLLRRWREQRRLSQLELASRAEVSTRHISYLETGRARPSREMVLRLADRLDLPLRERNELLLSAGFAPVYGESTLDAPRMAAVRTAVRQVLTGHEPYPAVVVDRSWNLVDHNVSLDLLTDLVDPRLLAPPANVLRASLHPRGLAPWIINFGQWRAHLLARLRREVAFTADAGLAQLHTELLDYPGDAPEPEPDGTEPADVVVPLRLRHPAGELAFFSMVATFGTPADITVAELMIESFFPADPSTSALLHDRGRSPAGG
jgi:transcriptional regulator with XRE-family HTH domain